MPFRFSWLVRISLLLIGGVRVFIQCLAHHRMRGCVDTWMCTFISRLACCLQGTQAMFRIQNEDFCLLPRETERRERKEELSLLNGEQLELVKWRPLLGSYLNRVHSFSLLVVWRWFCSVKRFQLTDPVVWLIKYYYQPFHPVENWWYLNFKAHHQCYSS